MLCFVFHDLFPYYSFVTYSRFPCHSHTATKSLFVRNKLQNVTNITKKEFKAFRDHAQPDKLVFSFAMEGGKMKHDEKVFFVDETESTHISSTVKFQFPLNNEQYVKCKM